MKHIFAFIVGLLVAFPAFAENNVKATLHSDVASIAPGKQFTLGVKLEHAPNWHTYWKDPGDAGLATTLTWQVPEGFAVGEIEWPPYTVLKEGTLSVNAYTDTILLKVPVMVPENVSQAFYSFTVKADWLVCHEICIPETATLSLELPVGDGAPSPNAALFSPAPIPAPPPVQPQADIALPSILLLALLGGLILNIMPCVLPVLSLKALSITQKTGRSWSHTYQHGVAYTLGILLSFAALAAILISLRQGGEMVGWGYQMQSPAFVTFLIGLLFLVGLSLSGLFHLPVLLGSVDVGQEGTRRESFFTGILAALVATPCTAPFMASAVGIALTLSSAQAMLVFLTLGFGLALPFLLISIFPGLLRFLPKPGAWMERFKEFLAFPIYATVIWLLWVLGLQTSVGVVALVLAGLLVIVLFLWIKRVAHRSLAAPLFILIVLGFGFLLVPKQLTTIETVRYSPAALAELRAQGKPVWLDVTAAWCITCQLNKHRALETEASLTAFKEHNVTLMIADWTKKNPEITELLRGFGFSGVPLNVYYPPNGEPVILPQIISEDTVISTISR